MSGDFSGAKDDYTQSLKYEKEGEKSVYVYIQLAVSLYKLGDKSGSKNKFLEAMKLFPESAEVFNYFAEILMDQQDIEKALEYFDKSIKMDPKSPLPYINKSILLAQFKQDFSAAVEMCQNAIKQDPLCDISYSQLGQLYCHQNKLKEALETYDKAIAVARTEAEVQNIVSCQEAARAQQYVMNAYPGALSKIAGRA